MQDNLNYAHYGHHFIIPADPGPYLAFPNGTSAPWQAELKAKHKDVKKAYNTAIAMQTFLWNQLIETIPDGYPANFWEPDRGYN